MNFGILVVEDNPNFALEIEMTIESIGYQYLGNPKDSFQTLKAIDLKKPDLIILDININGGTDRITLAKEFEHKKIPVIFITGYEGFEYFNRAREIDHLAYLVKPFHMLTLRDAIENAVSLKEKSKTLFVKNNNMFHKILIEKIKWVEVDGNYCFLYVEKKKHVVKMSLKKILESINQQNYFLQIHRNYIIQQKYITNYNSIKKVIKIDRKFIPVGRKYKSKVIALLRDDLN
jgi:Response regulator of the LytR/AlgR family